MPEKLPPYIPCSVCNATLSAQAIICPYYEAQLLPLDEPEGCLYGEAVLLVDVMPNADEFLNRLDDLHPDAAIHVEGMRDGEDVSGDEWKRR